MDEQILKEIEDLSAKLYTQTAQGDRAQIEQRLNFLLSPVADHIVRCQYVLERTTAPYAQVYAMHTLQRALTSSWLTLSESDRIAGHTYILQMLSRIATTAPSFVLQFLERLVVRSTKLGWMDHDSFQKLPQLLMDFSRLSGAHMILALRLLTTLVEEFNQQLSNRNQTAHRRSAVSFRDNALLSIFKYGIAELASIMSKDALPGDGGEGDSATLKEQVLTQILSLHVACYSYDFLGSSPDEMCDEVVTVHLPASWRSSLSGGAIVDTYLKLYESSQSNDRARKAMECLCNLASCRRSIFQSDKEHIEFLTHIMDSSLAILISKQGLDDPEIYHQFCRFLLRIKVKNQLVDIVHYEKYEQWIRELHALSVHSFRSWQWTSNSVHHLVTLWSRLVGSLPYLRQDSATHLDTFAPTVFESFLETRMQQLKASASDDSYDEILDAQMFGDVMEGLATIGRCKYEQSSQLISRGANQKLAALEALIKNGGTPDELAQLPLLEIELSFLVFLIAALVGTRVSISFEVYDQGDAQLTAIVLRAMRLQGIRQRGQALPAGPTTEYLELSFISFLQDFRRIFVEEHGLSSTRVFGFLNESCGIEDHSAVLRLTVDKILDNLKLWGGSQKIIARSLALFKDIAGGYSAGRILSELEKMQYLLSKHSAEHFPFLSNPVHQASRTSYYAVLGKVLFQTRNLSLFPQFVAPFDNTLRHMATTTSQQAVRQQLIWVLRDLRGFFISVLPRKYMAQCLTWLMREGHFNVIRETAKAFYHDPEVTSPLMKFYRELVTNKQSRLVFDSFSDTGYLLFHEIAKILSSFASFSLQFQPEDNVYRKKYKPLCIAQTILSRSLTGSFCNFGVFRLYGDRCLADSVSLIVKVSLSVHLEDVMCYPKLTTSYFSLLETLCSQCFSLVPDLGVESFHAILETIEKGISAYDATVSSRSCGALERFATFLFEELRSGQPLSQELQDLQRSVQSPTTNLLPRLLNQLFYTAIFENSSNIWALSRPLLPLILLQPGALQQLQQKLLERKTPRVQKRLNAAFESLTSEVDTASLDNRNRDKFTANLSLFRAKLKDFLPIG